MSSRIEPDLVNAASASSLSPNNGLIEELDMKKFLRFAFNKMPLAMQANPPRSAHHDEVGRGCIEDYLTASSDMDAVWYYERRRWRV